MEISRKDREKRIKQYRKEWMAAAHERDTVKARGQVHELATTAISAIGGVVPDTLQFGADALSYFLVAESPDVPFTSDEIHASLGGNPDRPYGLAFDVAAPGPGEIKQAIFVGAKGVGRMGKKAQELYGAAEKMLKDGVDPAIIQRVTGMTTWNSKTVQRWAPTESVFDHDRVRFLTEMKYPTGIPKDGGMIVAPLTDFVKDEKLYELYPELRHIKVNINVAEHSKTGKFLYMLPGSEEGKRGQINLQTGELTTFNPEDIRSTVLHEIQHYVDFVEDLPTGGSPADFTRLSEDIRIARASKELMGAMDEGFQIRDWNKPSEAESEEIMRIMETHGLDTDPSYFKEIRKTYEDYDQELLFGADAPEDSLKAFFDGMERGSTTKLSIMLDAFPDTVDLEAALDPITAQQLANERYYKLEGEARARVVQYLDNLGNTQDQEKWLQNFARTGEARGIEKPVRKEDLIER